MYTLFDQYEEEMTKNNFRVYSINGDEWSGQIIKDSQTLDQVFVKTSAKEAILERIRVFKEEKKRAKRFGKPYKLNFLLYGVPGAGKTSMVKAIAKHLKKQLYIFNFSKELTDNKMSALLKDVDSGSVLVFEDVDSFFVHRESNGCNISFSSLINQLDGIRNSDAGLITILTANHVDKLDPALLRAGRMDLLVKFDYPEQEEVKMAFDAYLDHLTQEERNALFKKWYPLVKNKKIPMSAFTDFLYKDYLNIIEKTPEAIYEAIRKLVPESFIRNI
jgi:SpoVK/Ycf46/Vps4 family AAA+-type ATPase